LDKDSAKNPGKTMQIGKAKANVDADGKKAKIYRGKTKILKQENAVPLIQT
jgi:hypothetical protein